MQLPLYIASGLAISSGMRTYIYMSIFIQWWLWQLCIIPIISLLPLYQSSWTKRYVHNYNIVYSPQLRQRLDKESRVYRLLTCITMCQIWWLVLSSPAWYNNFQLARSYASCADFPTPTIKSLWEMPTLTLYNSYKEQALQTWNMWWHLLKKFQKIGPYLFYCIQSNLFQLAVLWDGLYFDSII